MSPTLHPNPALTPASPSPKPNTLVRFHWQPGIFERTGHGWNYRQARRSGSNCRNVTSAVMRCGGDARCAECAGPFKFASGYLIVLSTSAAEWLTREVGTLRADVARLRGAGGGLVSRSGKPRDKVMEGVWDPTRTLILTQTPTPA